MVTCPSCSSDDLERIEALPDGGRRVRCVGCGHEWIRGGVPSMVPGTKHPPRPPDPSTVILFEGDDAAYEFWIARHPGGHVLNTTRPPSGDYLMMHLADCYHISEHSGPSGGKWTGNDYMKVCALRRTDLEAWVSDRFGRKPDRSTHCSP